MSKFLPALLEGCLPNSWKMTYRLRDDKAVLLANDASRCQRRVHAVLFFMAASAVHDDQELATVKEAFQMVCCIFIYNPLMQQSYFVIAIMAGECGFLPKLQYRHGSDYVGTSAAFMTDVQPLFVSLPALPVLIRCRMLLV